MSQILTMPPIDVIGGRFPNVRVIPRRQIVDPFNNVLLVAKLFNFSVDNDKLRWDHEVWLGSVAARLLRDHPAAGARIVGLASRSGDEQHNLRLGLRRAQNVNLSLSLFLIADQIVNPPSPPARVTVGSQGEKFWENLKVADGTEDAQHRAVMVTLVRDRRRPVTVQLLRP